MLTIKIITPEAVIFYKKKVNSITLQTPEGEINILPDHQPILSILKTGEMKVCTRIKKIYFVVDNGFIQCTNNLVLVLTEAAVDLKLIDLISVNKQKKRAVQALQVAREKDVNSIEIKNFESIIHFANEQILVKKKHN